MKDWLFITRRPDFWEDSWTYGDWRQYMCKRPDGSLQCARQSAIGIIATLLGVSLCVFLPMALWLRSEGVPGIVLDRALFCAVIGQSIIVTMLWIRCTGRVLMRAVGPRQYDGKRVFNWEVTP